MSDKLDLESKDLIANKLEQLEQLFPNLVTEGENGKVLDLDQLKNEFSTEVVEGTKERYRLEWPGKKEAIVTANLPTTKTLRPVKEDSVDFDNTENLYIEGDNLEVLKCLQESYFGKIKMIYIDPPYNTGKDFVYKDNFTKDVQEELEESGQKNEYNQRLQANPDSSGRYHSDWLSMMYPRLKLSRNLLSNSGAIFISLDDNEYHNLRKLLDEIYGESCFAGVFSWRSRTAKADVPYGISNDVEWVICYAKTEFIAGRLGSRKYHHSGDHPEGWRLQDLTKNTTKEERPNSFFTLVNPKNNDRYEASPTRTWSITPDTFPGYYEKGKIVFPGDYDFLNIKKPAFRVFESEDQAKAMAKYGTPDVRMSISTYLPEKEVGRTEHGSKEIRSLFGSQVFSYPKPTGLIKFFLESLCDPNSLILDFFSGSATLADSVMQVNSADNGNRKYILVQLPETLEEADINQKVALNFCRQHNMLSNLTEIGKERIRRAGAKIKEETGADIDYGFRVYRLDESNMADVYHTPQDYDQNNLELFADNVKEDRTADDLLAQIMLDWGLPLSLPIEETTIAGKRVFNVAGNSLMACFETGIDEDFAKQVAEEEPLRIVFKDAGFSSDTAKSNVKQLLKQLSPETEMKVI